MIDNKLVQEIIKTRSYNKHKRTSSQSIRDHERISKRIFNVGVMLDFVTAFFEKKLGSYVTVFSLLEIATKVSIKTKIKLDRLAKRNRTALLCWFAEHWNKVYPHLFQSDETSDDHQFSNPNQDSCDPELSIYIPPESIKLLEVLDISRLLN